MSTKTRKIDEQYTECDWCGRDILEKEERYIISGDFPTVHVHKDKCLRQSVSTGIENKE